MSDFERWFEENAEGCRLGLEGCISEQAWDFQQSKIEQLEKRISDLQYRVDSTLSEINRAVDCCESIETECVLVEIKEILRGNHD